MGHWCELVFSCKEIKPPEYCTKIVPQFTIKFLITKVYNMQFYSMQFYSVRRYQVTPRTHLPFRWFLLDFKREFSYCDIYLVWETIWASRFVVSSHFFLFVALALVENYRDIILDRNMDFTDIIKFFNEMAEKHDAKQILCIARELVLRLQCLISDK